MSGVRVRWMLPALLLALALPPGAQGRAGERVRRLEELRREIEKREDRALSYREEAEGVLGELEGLDRELTELRRSVAVLQRRERRTQGEVGGVTARLEESRTVLKKQRKTLERRLVALYKISSTGGLPALRSGDGVESFLRRRVAFARILEQDRRLFRSYGTAFEAWREQRDRKRELAEELRAARSAIESRQGRLAQRQVDRRELVARLRSRSGHEARAAEELRLAAERLEATLAGLESSFQPPPGAALARGQVPWPVQGPVRLGFGRQVNPEFGTQTRQTGIEIEAESGALVRAVGFGGVLFAGWFRGYGQLVILDHGDGVLSISGYLEQLWVEAGADVSEGEIIGTVGETGSLSGTGLYFEIRQDGSPVDPGSWLRARSREGA